MQWMVESALQAAVQACWRWWVSSQPGHFGALAAGSSDTRFLVTARDRRRVDGTVKL